MNISLLIHPKFFFVHEIEISTIYKQMVKVSDMQSQRILTNGSVSYKSKRIQLVKLILSMNSQFHYKTQTAYKAVNYMDEIGYSNIIAEQNFGLIALSSFALSAKFCENDPSIPSQNKFCDALYKSSKGKYYATIADLAEYEVQCAKFLQYKLQRYTLYDFICFYFVCGFILSDKNNNNNNDDSNRSSENTKLLEQIYNKARGIIDYLLIMEGEFVYYHKCYSIAKNVIKLASEDTRKEKNAIVIDNIYKEEQNDIADKEKIDEIKRKVIDVYEHLKSKKTQMKRVFSDKAVDNSKVIINNIMIRNQFRKNAISEIKGNNNTINFNINSSGSSSKLNFKSNNAIIVKQTHQNDDLNTKSKNHITIFSNYKISLNNQPIINNNITNKENTKYDALNTISFNHNKLNPYRANSIYDITNSNKIPNYISKNSNGRSVFNNFYSLSKRNEEIKSNVINVFTPKSSDILTRTLSIFREHNIEREIKRDFSTAKLQPFKRNFRYDIKKGFHYPYKKFGFKEYFGSTNNYNYY